MHVPGTQMSSAVAAQTAGIIKTSAAKPADRMAWIETCINKHADLPHDPTLAAFQMKVEGSMVDVAGRHLPPPELMYDKIVRRVTLSPYLMVMTPGMWG